MKYRLILGVILPILIIIGLAVSVSLGEVEETKNFEKEISIKTIITENSIRDNIKVGEIRLTNNFALSKRHEIPFYGACLIDTEKQKNNIDIGTIEVYQGDYVYDDAYGSRENYRSIELTPHEEKIINVYLKPSYYYYNKGYDTLLAEYKGYDTLLIYEKKQLRNGRDYPFYYQEVSCYTINPDIIEESIKIPLIP